MARRFLLLMLFDVCVRTTASAGFTTVFVYKENSIDMVMKEDQHTLVTCCSLAGTTTVEAEVRFGSSRFDLRLILFVDVISINESLSKRPIMKLDELIFS